MRQLKQAGQTFVDPRLSEFDDSWEEVARQLGDLVGAYPQAEFSPPPGLSLFLLAPVEPSGRALIRRCDMSLKGPVESVHPPVRGVQGLFRLFAPRGRDQDRRQALDLRVHGGLR